MLDFHKLIDSYKDCNCGLEHRCEINDIRVGSGLVNQVGNILRENGFPEKILLVEMRDRDRRDFAHNPPAPPKGKKPAPKGPQRPR